MYYNNSNNNRNNNNQNSDNGRRNNNVAAEESEVISLTKALGHAIQRAVVTGSKNLLTEAISQGVTNGAKELTLQFDKNIQQLNETIANNLKELSIAAPAPTTPVDIANMVSGEEYEKMESLLRQTKDRLGEVNRQNLMSEAEVKRLKSVLETKELAIQEKLTMLSKANAENKELKLQMVDLEGKVRIMRKESEDNSAAVKLATTQKQDAINETAALKEELAAAKQRVAELETRLEQVNTELASAKNAAPAPVGIVKANKPVKDVKDAKAPKATKTAKSSVSNVNEEKPVAATKAKAKKVVKKVTKKADKE